MDGADRREHLQRLVLGLEMSIEDMRARLPYYSPDDVEFKYAKKFLASMEENLVKAREELRQCASS